MDEFEDDDIEEVLEEVVPKTGWGKSKDNPIPIDHPDASFSIGGLSRPKVPAKELIMTCDIDLPSTMWLVDTEGKLHRSAYVSHSQIMAYSKCHKFFYWKYLKRRPDLRAAPKMWTGSGFHNAMEEAAKAKIEGRPYSISDGRKTFETHMEKEFSDFDQGAARAIANGKDPLELKLPERLESREDLVRLGGDMVEMFLTTEMPKIKPVAAEKKVVYRMPMVNRPGSIPFVGYVDLIEETPEGLQIDDYKTGRLRTQENLESDQQLVLYALAENIFNASWLNVKMGTTGGKTPKRAKPAEFLKLKKKVTIKDQEILHEDFNAHLEGIAAGNFARTGLTNSTLCSSRLCPYWHECLGKGKVDSDR